MQWSDIPRNPTPRMLRQFAALWILVFGSLALWQWYQGQPSTARWTALISAVGILGVARPRLARPVFVGWMILAFPIGWVVSRVLLGLVFFGLFTPMAAVFRLMGRDELLLRRRRDGASYWRPKAQAADRGQYFRQY